MNDELSMEQKDLQAWENYCQKMRRVFIETADRNYGNVQKLLSRANELAWAAREELIKHRAKVNSPAVSAWNDMLTDNQKLMIILKEKDYELLIDYMDASLEMAWLCRDYAAAQIHKPKSAAKKEPDNSPAV